MRKTSRVTPLALASALLLSGCSTINNLLDTEQTVDYRSTVSGDPLSIPPDLTQANRDASFRAPAGAGTTYSQYAQAQAAQRGLNDRSNVLPQVDGIQVMRDGELRWLVIDQAPEAIFGRVIDFWLEQGFTIQSQDPRAGLVQTDWAENRAKIPEGWIRTALGGILDQVFDSGERDRFRTRMERVNGRTEVYISHQNMVETPTGDAEFRWLPGKEDPNLNGAMLARLMVFLGTDVQKARSLVAEAGQTRSATDFIQATDGGSRLLLREPFDRAWRRVGVAIDAAHFAVDDRDRASGDYFIRYLDSDTGVKMEQPGFFSRMFGARTTEAPVFRIRVTDQGGQSIVSVLDAQGGVQSDATARRIIEVLADQMGAGR